MFGKDNLIPSLILFILRREQDIWKELGQPYWVIKNECKYSISFTKHVVKIIPDFPLNAVFERNCPWPQWMEDLVSGSKGSELGELIYLLM